MATSKTIIRKIQALGVHERKRPIVALTRHLQHPLGAVDPEDDRPGGRLPDRRQQGPGAGPDVDHTLSTGEGQALQESFSQRLYGRAPEAIVCRGPLRVTARELQNLLLGRRVARHVPSPFYRDPPSLSRSGPVPT